MQPLELRTLGRFTRVGEAGVAVRSVKYEDVRLRACCLGFGAIGQLPINMATRFTPACGSSVGLDETPLPFLHGAVQADI